MDDKNDRDFQELEKELTDLLEQGAISKEDYEKAKTMLHILNNRTKKRNMNKVAYLKQVIINFLTYFIIYCATFGFFANKITFTSKIYPFIFFVIFIVVLAILRHNFISKFIKKKFGFANFTVVFMILFSIVLYFVNPYLYFVEFNNSFSLIGFYLVSELLYFLFTYVKVKKQFNKMIGGK